MSHAMSAAGPRDAARTSAIIPKVLVTKIGFDGHDRGSRIVAAGLRDAGDPADNVSGRVVAAAEAGCTHGEICHTLRREMGFGDVQAIV